MYLTVK